MDGRSEISRQIIYALSSRHDSIRYIPFGLPGHSLLLKPEVIPLYGKGPAKATRTRLFVCPSRAVSLSLPLSRIFTVCFRFLRNRGSIAMDGNSTAPNRLKDPRTIARKYQLDLCKRAVEENIIVYLGTGCGKTHIAVLLMYELGHLIRKPSKSICIFLAPTVPLVRQQAMVIESSTDFKVRCHYGSQKNLKDHDDWNKEMDQSEVRMSLLNCFTMDMKNDVKEDMLNAELAAGGATFNKQSLSIYTLVLVMTPQILLQNLRHCFIRMDLVALLIFDECHHAQAQTRHPYAQIMRVIGILTQERRLGSDEKQNNVERIVKKGQNLDSLLIFVDGWRRWQRKKRRLKNSSHDMLVKGQNLDSLLIFVDGWRRWQRKKRRLKNSSHDMLVFRYCAHVRPQSDWYESSPYRPADTEYADIPWYQGGEVERRVLGDRDGGTDLSNYTKCINSLENLLDAKVCSVDDELELEGFVASPDIKVYFYGPLFCTASSLTFAYSKKLEDIKVQECA
ncbi:hypothetical protein MUK42_13295 [Musa troglodytarum]|uniref:Helicase ATP-binding domain-containing protein n=1 Tax=Musa troglodytarum TaxID=320322 RepID=A0A9E7HK27_9LILI|nr:hypothetical protein MUK42_13295 [Musa troglodytarum]